MALFNPEVAKLEDCLKGLDQDRAVVKEEIARLKERLQAVTASKEKYLQETLDMLRQERDRKPDARYLPWCNSGWTTSGPKTRRVS